MEISARDRVGRALVWFRRDLRSADHPALAHALRDARQVWCAFVLDKTILDGLPPDDRRFAFIRSGLVDLDLAGRCGRSPARGVRLLSRVFNPVTQSGRFDSQGTFIRRWVPELGKLGDEAIHAPWKASAPEPSTAQLALGKDYPHPIVDHAAARERTLARFGSRGSGSPVVSEAG